MADRKPLIIDAGQVGQIPAADTLTANQLKSTVVTGTPPLVVASDNLVVNLNADKLDGFHADDLADAVHTHGAADIVTGVIATARLGSGTADATTFLRGDQTWQIASAAHTHNAADITAGTMATARLGSGVADATKFLRGDQTWQPAAAAPDGFTTIISAADEDVINAQNVDHSEFQFPVAAGKRYMIDMLFWSSGSSSTGDYRFRFVVAAGTMAGLGVLQGRDPVAGPLNELIIVRDVAQTTNHSIGTDSNLEVGTAIRLTFVFTVETTTTFKFQFGNNTPGVGVTSRTGKGSIMRWKQMN